MSSISFGGLVSGLETGTIIDQLVEIQRIPITLLEEDNATFESQKSATEDFKNMLSSIRTQASGLMFTTNWASRTATSSNTSYLTASAQDSALTGSYTIQNIASLASAQIDIFDGIADTDTSSVGTGTFSITIDPGGSNESTTNITISAGSSTLEDLVAAINNADAGVSASIINDGTSSNPYRLSLTSKNTGTDYDFSHTISTDLTGGDVTLSKDAISSSAAADATFDVGNLTITSSTNTISNVISGVTFSLVSVPPSGTSVTIAVDNDVAGITAKIESLVDEFNTFVVAANEQFAYDPETETSGVLSGDTGLKIIQQRVQSLFTGAVPGLSGDYIGPANIGFSTNDKTGEISINSATLKEALESDWEAVRNIFIENTSTTGITTTGMARSLYDDIYDYINPSDGMLTERIARLDDRIEDNEEKIDDMEARLADYENRLVAQFTAMETTLAEINAQGDYLASYLSTL